MFELSPDDIGWLGGLGIIVLMSFVIGAAGWRWR
jgi:hypothetical protein